MRAIRACYATGKVGKTVQSRSGKNLPPTGQGECLIAIRWPVFAPRDSVFAVSRKTLEFHRRALRNKLGGVAAIVRYGIKTGLLRL